MSIDWLIVGLYTCERIHPTRFRDNRPYAAGRQICPMADTPRESLVDLEESARLNSKSKMIGIGLLVKYRSDWLGRKLRQPVVINSAQLTRLTQKTLTFC